MDPNDPKARAKHRPNPKEVRTLLRGWPNHSTSFLQLFSKKAAKRRRRPTQPHRTTDEPHRDAKECKPTTTLRKTRRNTRRAEPCLSPGRLCEPFNNFPAAFFQKNCKTKRTPNEPHRSTKPRHEGTETTRPRHDGSEGRPPPTVRTLAGRCENIKFKRTTQQPPPCNLFPKKLQNEDYTQRTPDDETEPCGAARFAFAAFFATKCETKIEPNAANYPRPSCSSFSTRKRLHHRGGPSTGTGANENNEPSYHIEQNRTAALTSHLVPFCT